MTHAQVPDGFTAFSFTQDIDLDAVRRTISAGSVVKGMFLGSVVEAVTAAGKTLPRADRFLAFKDYPSETQLDLLVDAARALHPDVPLREGIRRIGAGAYPALVSSMIGKVIFGVLGTDITKITKLVHKAYEISGKPARATLIDLSANHSLVRLDQTLLPDCYQVGIFEGVFRLCGKVGEVYGRALTDESWELYSRWR